MPQLIRRGGRLLSAKLTRRGVPFHVTLQVTNRCNLRCVYCASPYRDEEELALAEWRAVLDELHALGTERVLFFGGEPLLRKDLADMVAHARRLGLACALTSNGTLVPRRPEVIRRLTALTLSLDGDAAAHDRNRGAGNHVEVMRAIEAARAWGVPVKLNAVLNANNAASLDWLSDFSRRQRLPLTINLMRKENNGLWHTAHAHALDDDAMRTLIRRIQAEKARNPWIVFSHATYAVASEWRDFTRDRLDRTEVDGGFRGPRCSAGRFHCVIYSDGRLFPCTLTVGRLPALDVRKVGVAKALAQAAGHDCAACFSPCMLEQNALFALHPAVVWNLARTSLRQPLG